jgi:hypothetical protein
MAATDSQKLAASLSRQAQSERMAAQAALRFARSLQILLHASRLYQKTHPQFLESLDAAERQLREALEWMAPVAFRVERSAIYLGVRPPGTLLPDSRGQLKLLAEDLTRRGVMSLILDRNTHIGELHSFVELLNQIASGATPLPAESEWAELMERYHIAGIRVNARVEEQKAGTSLASLISAVLQLDLSTWKKEEGEGPAKSSADTVEELSSVLRLLGRIAGALGENGTASQARTGADLHTPGGAAAELQRLFQDSSRTTVTILVASLQQQVPREAESLEYYLSRLAETLTLEFVVTHFREGRIRVEDVRSVCERLAHEVAAAGGLYPGALRPVLGGTGMKLLPGGVQWTEEAFAEYLHQRFWEQMEAREKAEVLRGRTAWCLPVGTLKSYLEQLISAGGEREARFALLNYAQCLESRHATARRTVAAALSDFVPLIETLWPGYLPEELSRGVIRALAMEPLPDVGAVLAGILERLARLAIKKNDFAEVERLLEALETLPPATRTLAERVHQNILHEAHWQVMMAAALDNRPLDPALPKLLGRDPTRVLEDFTRRLGSPRGVESLPAMARLLRAIGEPVIEALVKQLFDARTPQAAHAGAAVKLLAAARPERLVEALPKALPGWEWKMQDLAVCELVRQRTPGVAAALHACLEQAHPLVVPMMIDEIGVSKEAAAVPLLLEVAGGTHAKLKDVYVRIKAVEALSRMRVGAAADVFRAILRSRDGLMHTEPAGLRSAAEEALGLMENRPSSVRVRTASSAAARASSAFMRPRRYLRIPLESPLPARVLPAGASPETAEGIPARVQTISLGGAFLESSRRLNVGEAFTVLIKTGLRNIQSTAVVRNVAANGSGVEFVHMRQDDREKLRRLISKLSRD